MRTAAFLKVKSHCLEIGVAPYFVPSGGLMVTPPYDCSDEMLDEAGRRLVAAVTAAAATPDWPATK